MSDWLDEALSLLPTFEVGQVTGDLDPGRRRHDWCSAHGDIGPMESIDAHARRAHGASSEAIRKARKTLRRAAFAASVESAFPLGHGTPVPEEATLPSGDARVAGL